MVNVKQIMQNTSPHVLSMYKLTVSSTAYPSITVIGVPSNGTWTNKNQN